MKTNWQQVWNEYGIMAKILVPGVLFILLFVWGAGELKEHKLAEQQRIEQAEKQAAVERAEKERGEGKQEAGATTDAPAMGDVVLTSNAFAFGDLSDLRTFYGLIDADDKHSAVRVFQMCEEMGRARWMEPPLELYFVKQTGRFVEVREGQTENTWWVGCMVLKRTNGELIQPELEGWEKIQHDREHIEVGESVETWRRAEAFTDPKEAGLYAYCKEQQEYSTADFTYEKAAEKGEACKLLNSYAYEVTAVDGDMVQVRADGRLWWTARKWVREAED